MEDPPFPTHPPYNSKRLFAGGSSSSTSSFDADVIEIPPPPTWKPKRLKHNLTVQHEVIDIDDEGPDDITIIDGKFASKRKGKKPMINNNAPKKSSSTEAIIIDDDFHGIDLTDISYDDDCVMLQAHFDNFDVPTGVEATVPWWPGSFGDQSSSSSSFVPKPFNPQIHVPTPGVDHFKPWSSHKAKSVKHYESKHGYFNPKLHPFGNPMDSSFNAPPNAMMAPWALPQVNKFNPFQNESLDKWGLASNSIAYPVEGPLANTSTPSPFFSEFNPGCPYGSIFLDEGISAQISPPFTSGEQGDGENSILKRLENFKKFDTLEDHSDHLYLTAKESVKQSKSWSRTIAEEWRMLEKDLPGGSLNCLSVPW